MTDPALTGELDGVWQTLTGEKLGGDAAEITGGQSVLPGPFRVAAAATASIGAATLAAGELLRARGIEPGKVSVGTRHAAAAFQSERYLRVDGESPGEFWAPLSGNYRAADGWVRLHCNYPQHAAAVCWALGVPATREAVAKAVAARPALEVETAVVGAGGAAAMLRTRDEWLAHPQGQAVGELPVVQIDPLGPAPKREVFDSLRPMGRIRVLELTHVIAGPVAGRVLTAHGANVLHVGAAHLPAVHPLTIDTGMGKRSAFLDLDSDGGRAKLRKLVSRADVFIQSFRPGSLAALGFGADDLAELRPGIVVADLSAYGWEGPWSRRRGFDSLVQLTSGIADESGRTAGLDVPGALPVQALDHATGWLAAAGVMTALRRSMTEGGSWHVRLSLAGTGRWLDSLGRKETEAPELDTTGLLEDVDSPFGRLTRVKVPGTLPGAPPYWFEASHLPGSDKSTW